SNIQVQIPCDIIDLMGNPIEIKNSDLLGNKSRAELQDKAEIFASNIPFNEFYHSASMAGILKDGNPLATWYRGISKGKISIEIKSIKYKGFNPRYPELWKLGDSIENLDIPLTLSNNPIIVPNITTKKWNKELEFGMSISKTIPDLLLVLDSSGSMKWNYAAPKKNSRGSFHSAVIASFATIQHAIGKGAKCNVINFSNIATTTSWTTDLDILEQEILQYKGSGTILPIEDIFKACNLVDGKVLVVIISDFALHNLADSKKFMYEIIAQDHFLVGFFITNKFNKNKYNEVFRELNLYLINDPRDLENLVINNIQKYYT
ncbi:MAG: VWA domain-containing protein, partial [Candidatus Lokiarchaeota archaeon]|nr:VWA domain-containing protein [Candidatus Lokiarchaeota archaeon]